MSSWEHNVDEHAYIRAEEARERNAGLEYEEYHERMVALREDERYEDEPAEDEEADE